MRHSRRRRTTRSLALLDGDESAPEFALLNLVDLMLVFSLGLMLAIVSYYGLQELLLPGETLTLVKSREGHETEILIKKPQSIERMRLTDKTLDGEGVRIGIAYRLNSGEIVYVPEDGASSSTATDRGSIVP